MRHFKTTAQHLSLEDMFRILELTMDTEVSETCLPNLKMLCRCFEMSNINDRNKYPKKTILVSCSASQATASARPRPIVGGPKLL